MRPPNVSAEEGPVSGELVVADAELSAASRATWLAWGASVLAWESAMIGSRHHPWLAALLWGIAGAYALGALALGVVIWRIGPERARALTKRHLETTLRGRLSVDHEGLRLDGVSVLERSEITRGQVDVSADGRAVLVLHRRLRRVGRWLGPVAVALPSEALARTFARTLGTDLESTAMESIAGSPLERLWALPSGMALFVSLVAILFGHGAAWINLVPAVACLFALVATAPLALAATLRIGTDGVEYRWLGRRRFVSYGSVVEVQQERSGATLTLRDGTKVSWRFPFVRLTVARLLEALAAYRANASDEGAMQLARGERSREEWVRDLREIGAGGARGYRVSPPSKDALWRIVEDPAADVAARAASAVALGATLDDAGRHRLRVAAKVTALPELSAVLEGEAEADAAAAEGALEALERKHALGLST